MSDGHSGIKNEQVNNTHSEYFQFVLSYLKQASNINEFIIHITSDKLLIGAKLSPLEYLSKQGFHLFNGQCPFHENRCFYTSLHTLSGNANDYRYDGQVEFVHSKFNMLSKNIDSLYKNAQETTQILGGLALNGKDITIVDCIKIEPETKGPQAQVKDLGGNEMANDDKIFIVHGHDEGAKDKVARFINKLGLKEIILKEQPDGGKTIIEKLEANSNVGFVIVLLTPDDVGSMVSESENQKHRARQNVIFELGYFVGKLQRGRVCLLQKGVCEIPSDLHGVIYKQMDEGGAWGSQIVYEIEEAGIKIDGEKLKEALRSLH